MDAETKIMQAMQRLLLVHSFDKITVKMILKESEVARSTFYRHFSDKYEVMNMYYKKFAEKTLSFAEEFDVVGKTEEVIHFFYENKSYFCQIVKYQGQNSFAEFYYEYSYQYLSKLICMTKGALLSDNEKIAMELYCAGTCHCITNWMNRGMDTEPHMFARQLFTAFPMSLHHYFPVHYECPLKKQETFDRFRAVSVK